MTGGPEREVATAALRWTAARRDDFALPPDILAPDTDVNRTLKPLGELAQLSGSILRHTAPDDERHRLARESVDWAWEQTARGALFADLLRCEPFATYPLEIYAAFAAVGLCHPRVQDFCATMTRTRGWRLLEQPPNRRLGVLNCEARTGFVPHDAAPAVLRRTWLGGLPEPWTFEHASGYALTHTVFHLTDWGRAPQRVPPDLARYLTVWLPAWLDGCLEQEQWDLACELLAVAASVPGPGPRDASRAAWERIAAVQRPDGAVPEAGATAPAMANGRTFWNCYHSTLVAAFAATLATFRLAECAPPAAGGGSRPVPAGGDTIGEPV
ncbi:hypothetical protein POF50_004145 [Streptomyces sp. SL13]|uniref:DUF6895 domain-containing protein n=1 Tax=Streptantibioticus silvisoli TaxID=2705255 RepID=A0AA90GV65_9ACTN|nr:hypothetical protein [Streptantibioticus silvisoli]MDI5968544.1 hypothetical protein [Streptantibioticus silvisoli]